MASPIQWTGICANSRRCWRTGKPGVPWSMGSQRVDMTERLNNNNKSITFHLKHFYWIKICLKWVSTTCFWKWVHKIEFHLSRLNPLLHCAIAQRTRQPWVCRRCSCVNDLARRSAALPPSCRASPSTATHFLSPFPRNWINDLTWKNTHRGVDSPISLEKEHIL